MEEKLCKTCGELKPIVEFEKRYDSKDGYRQQCKQCKRINSTFSKAKNAEEDSISFWRVRAYSLNNAKSRRTGKSADIIANSEPISPLELQTLYNSNIKCYYCGISLVRQDIVFDHKTPLSANGSHEISNIAICCKDCNKLKDTRTEKEFRDFLINYLKRFN